MHQSTPERHSTPERRSTPQRRATDRLARRTTGNPPLVPSTSRGRATRAALIQAAREVFERDGFLDARIADITALANTATGSFYSYFPSKEEIFSAVVDDTLLREGLQQPGLAILADAGENLVPAMAQYHREYLIRYAKTAKLMSVMEQVTNISPEFREHRVAIAQPVMRSSADAIRRLQAAGVADPGLHPLHTARSLSVMVSRSAYVAFVLERETIDQVDVLVATLGRLWLNGLGIKVDPSELAKLG